MEKQRAREEVVKRKGGKDGGKETRVKGKEEEEAGEKEKG